MAVTLQWPDILIIVVYFVSVLVVGMAATFKAQTSNTQGYFLAGQSSNWILIASSTWATNMGAPMFIGLAGSAAAGGIVVTMFEWHAMIMLVALGWFFLPVYKACGCSTVPEYLQKRYGGRRIRFILTIAFLFMIVISGISGQIFSGVTFIRQIFGWNTYLSVALILAITAVYTIGGGLLAVLWTDAIQTAILLVGSFALSIICLIRIGGFEEMRWRYDKSFSSHTAYYESLHGNLSCGLPDKNAWHIFRPLNESNPWLGMIFGLTILATNYFCTDQIIVQRALSAKTIAHAKVGVVVAGYFKILPFVFFVIPGMVSRVLFPDEVACSNPDQCNDICGNKNGCSNIAYPLLVLRIMPVGIRGLMLAALLAALVSSLTSIFNSASTVFTIDIWKVLRTKATERELTLVGRVFTFILVAISVAWLPILEAIQGSQLWDYIQQLNSYIWPPIVVVFLLGIFTKSTTEFAAFLTLIICIPIGLVRLILTFVKQAPPCGSTEPDNQWDFIAKVHYLHFAIILAGLSLLVAIPTSFFTKKRPENKLRRRTFWNRFDKLDNEESDEEIIVKEEDEKQKEKTPIENDDDVKSENNVPVKKRNFFYRLICAQKQVKEYKPSREELLKRCNIDEDPKTSFLLNINAVVAIGVCVFIHAFWA